MPVVELERVSNAEDVGDDMVSVAGDGAASSCALRAFDSAASADMLDTVAVSLFERPLVDDVASASVASDVSASAP